MKPINLNNIEEKSAGGDYKRLVAGAYACIVTKVEDNPRGEYLSVELDIVAGEFEGYFKDSFYDNKPFAHRTVMSYKDENLGYFKHNLRAFTESNTGFDAEAAIMGGQEQMLVGKVVGCTFRDEEFYDKKSGEFKLGSPRPSTLIPTSAIETANTPKPKMLTDDEKRSAMRRHGASEAVIAAYERNSWVKPDEDALAPAATDAYDGPLPF